MLIATIPNGRAPSSLAVVYREIAQQRYLVVFSVGCNEPGVSSP